MRGLLVQFLAALIGLAYCVAARGLQADDDASLGDDRTAMIRRIDALIAERWQQSSAIPAESSSDDEFLRRVYLDLTGVIPRVAEARAFLADTAEDKRGKLVDALLASPGHATHLANTWRNLMLPGGLEVAQFQNIAGVQNWLRAQFVNNMRFDRVVSDFLVATGGGDSGPALYYTSLELKPEKLAASTARIFLGLQIECAECHDHPFDHWKQRDFWGYAAYFAQLRQSQQQPSMVNVSLTDLDQGDVKLPGSEEIVPPQFPGAASVTSDETGARRVQLAIWMASRDNPYLARATVNRVWAQLFGRGIVEPVDDLSRQNAPSHPELFDELAHYFVKSGFDLRELYRTLVNTRAYQLSSKILGDAPAPDLFAGMAVKTLTAEQLYDSIARVAKRRSTQNGSPFGLAAGRLFDPQRIAFVSKMELRGRSATEFDGGVPQALTLMNGMDVAQATSTEQSNLLLALDSDLFSDETRIETLFLATLSRYPAETERAFFLKHLQQSVSERKDRLGDTLWALLNSVEFGLNH